MVRRVVSGLAVGFLAAMLSVLAGAASAGAVEIQAHRGGPNVEGAGVYPENSMSAFRHALEQGWVIELDLGKSSDGVAVVMHDDTLDRTTNCTGKLSLTPWDTIRNCELDRIGINDGTVDLPAGDERREPVPQLSDVLTLLKETGGRANIEVKDIEAAFAEQVYHQIAASGVAPEKLILQNFNKFFLIPVGAILPGAGAAFLVPSDNESSTFASAKQVGANWVSPIWPVSAGYVSRAHAQGFKVVPWTVDDEESLLAVAAAGADAVISNDPTLAQRLIGPVPKPDPITKPGVRLRWRLAGAGRTLRRGKTAVYKVRLKNTGKSASGRIRVTAAARGKAALAGGKKRMIGKIPAGGSRIVKFRVRVRPNARPGTRIRLVVRAAALRKSDRAVPARRTRVLRVIR